MDPDKALAFLDELQGRGIKLGLERMRSFLDFIGNPEKNFKSVHVAGTNGKGSTATMIESILREAGYKTGLYTSPHLVRFNERIRVWGKEISDEQLAALITELKQKMEESKIDLTYFEFITALAFKHFADSKLDIAIVEVGMGGRLDATNLITPIVSVITNVEKEHEEFLGKTVEAIASEKAGIIKEKVSLVTAEWKSDILWLFRQQCMKKGSDMLIVDKPFEGDLRMQVSFQRWNAATAIGVIEKLREHGFHVKKKAIERGLLKAHWPGRFDLVQRNPDVILDCGHNPGGCFVLSKAFEEIFPEEKAILVVGASNGKDISAMAELIAPLAKKVFATAAKYRPMPAEKVSEAFEKFGKETEAIEGVENALRKALEAAGKNDVILVTGSCFVVGEAVEFFSKTG